MAWSNFPQGQFGAILADPPWKFETWSDAGKGRSAERHYPTMNFDQLKALPVSEVAAKDCVLFLWATWPMLLSAISLIDAWHFKYKTCGFAWMKNRPLGGLSLGTGYWTRANTEVCLLAARGHPKRLNADVPQAILEPRREHSRKPDVYERIERLVGGPYLELFARQRRSNWVSWGNEVDKRQAS